MNSSFQLSQKEFQQLRELIYQNFGIHLTDQKRSMIEGRLQTLVRSLELNSFGEYYQYLLQDQTGTALVQFLNRITTNHTYFYREKEHFDFLEQTALPDLKKKLEKSFSRDLRVWSAGCSSGEEPYNLIMLMMESLGPEYAQWDAGVLATDISEKVLRIAQSGVYPWDRVNRLPKYYLTRYFQKLRDEQYQVVSTVKKEVVFRKFNLMNAVFPFKKPFHVIFCRNVMIYFDKPTTAKLVQRFADSLEPNGYFFIGHSETLGRNHPDLLYIKPGIYRKKA